MVKVPVNSDISSFKTTVWAGLTAKQVVSGLVGLVMCVPLCLILSLGFKVDMYISVTISMPLMLVSIYVCNYEKNDFNLYETYKYGLNKKRTDILMYRSTENADAYQKNYEVDYKLERAAKNKDIDEDDLFELYMKLFKIAVVLVILAAVGIVAFLIYSKTK
mgnify:FL=1